MYSFNERKSLEVRVAYHTVHTPGHI